MNTILPNLYSLRVLPSVFGRVDGDRSLDGASGDDRLGVVLVAISFDVCLEVTFKFASFSVKGIFVPVGPDESDRTRVRVVLLRVGNFISVVFSGENTTGNYHSNRATRSQCVTKCPKKCCVQRSFNRAKCGATCGTSNNHVFIDGLKHQLAGMHIMVKPC